jgi:hypothetical protein
VNSRIKNTAARRRLRLTANNKFSDKFCDERHHACIVGLRKNGQARRRSTMSRYVTARIAAAFVMGFAAAALVSTAAGAANDAEAAAMKQATATCKAQVKEEAQYHEMSLWARHKAVKKCVKEALAHH